MFNTRGIFVAVILSSTLNLVSAAEVATKCPRKPEPATSALKKKLLCNYDRTMVPMIDTTRNINVLHKLLPDFFIFDEYINALEIHGEMFLEWQDEYLTWTEGEYNGVEELLMQTTEIWVPHIELSTPASMHYTGSYQSNPTCEVSSNGIVNCIVPLVYEAHCNPDVRRWPFDSHKCSLSVTTKTLRVNLTEKEQQPYWEKYRDSDNYWRLVESNSYTTFTGIDNTKWPTIVYTLAFERHSSFFIAIVLLPSIVMLTATLCAFCLDPAGIARIFLIGTNIICHCLFLMYLAWYIPGNGDKTPVVMTFFRDSLLLVGVSLVVTISVATMAAASSSPPGWLSAIVDEIHASPARCLLFHSLYATESDVLGDGEPDNVDAVMAASGANKWRRIATFLDRVTLLLVAAILAVLASAFLP